MGPRLDSRGRPRLLRAVREILALQWGRGWTAAEGMPSKSSLGCVRLLQWGRGWTAAEGLAFGVWFHYLAELQWGRGWTAAEGSWSLP